MARRRRRHARKARANPRRRRVSRRRLRANPKRRSSKRRLRRNPGSGAFARAEAPGSVIYTLPKTSTGLERIRGGKKKRKKLSKAEKRLSKRGRSLSKRAKSMSPGLRKSVALTQAKRLSTLARGRGGKVGKSPVYKAMHIKSNPGMAGLIVAAKVLAPQAAVGGLAMVGLAMGGKLLASKIQPHAPVALQPYVPAISTVIVTGIGYVVADKVAPKFKGAVAIGGLLGAIVQGIVAASKAAPGGLMEKAQLALLGDYTTVGGRAYADGGLFREIGDYTAVGAALEARDGGAYSNQRPRRGERDNATQWALSGALEARDGGAYSNQRPRRGERDNATEWAVDGLDDTTEFASGEGGVLSGGLFRGSSR